MMSSVVAVVKKVRRNDEDNDEYNPMKMLKTSIASKVQVRYQKLSNKFIFISFVLIVRFNLYKNFFFVQFSRKTFNAN